jgi:hypothetical protein
MRNTSRKRLSRHILDGLGKRGYRPAPHTSPRTGPKRLRGKLAVDMGNSRRDARQCQQMRRSHAMGAAAHVEKRTVGGNAKAYLIRASITIPVLLH